MTTHRTHDSHAQPPARSAAGYIEPEAIAHRATNCSRNESAGRNESSTIGCTPNTN